MPTVKIPHSMMPEIVAVQERFNLSCKQVADWLLKDKGIEVSGTAVQARLKKYHAKGK